MALASSFYKGVVTDAVRAANRAGAPDYGVYGADDFKVRTHPSIPYALVVNKGKAHGHGVTDNAVADETVQCTSLASGVRWDLIVIRRDWRPAGGASTLVAIPGGAFTDIPAGRQKTPGVVDDQPIAFVMWEGAQNTPKQIIDLRCWAGNGGMVAVDALAKVYLARPGACLAIGESTFRYEPQGNNIWDWSEVSGTSGSTASSIMRRDSSNVTAVGTVLLTTSQGADNRAATRKDYVDQQVVKLATQSAAGAMSAADKKKLDQATPNATAGTLVQLDIAGRAKVANPSAATDIANKQYVDGLTPTKFATGTAIIAMAASQTFKSVSVPLPSGFTGVPTIALTITSNVGYPATRLTLSAINKSTSKFDAKLATDDGETLKTSYEIHVDWIAVQS